jgi:hypothetical protein
MWKIGWSSEGTLISPQVTDCHHIADICVRIRFLNWVLDHSTTSAIYRSLQVYQQSNTQVGHRVLSDFTLKMSLCDSNSVVIRLVSNYVISIFLPLMNVR